MLDYFYSCFEYLILILVRYYCHGVEPGGSGARGGGGSSGGGMVPTLGSTGLALAPGPACLVSSFPFFLFLSLQPLATHNFLSLHPLVTQCFLAPSL